MLVIVSVTPVEFSTPDPGEKPRAILRMVDTDGEEHLLEFADGSLAEVADAFRQIQAAFPGLLGGH